MKVKITCLNCGDIRKTYKSNLVGSRGKYCCLSCYWENKKGKPNGKKGIKLTDEHKAKISKANKGKLIGKNNPRWNKDPDYRAIHKYIQLRNGKPEICIGCGKVEGILHWANISGVYTRNVKDYIGMCSGCHGSHDQKGGEVLLQQI